MCRLIEKVASANVTVMLLGGSTGKEVLARGLRAFAASQLSADGHQLCRVQGIPLESELFG